MCPLIKEVFCTFYFKEGTSLKTTCLLDGRFILTYFIIIIIIILLLSCSAFYLCFFSSLIIDDNTYFQAERFVSRIEMSVSTAPFAEHPGLPIVTASCLQPSPIAVRFHQSKICCITSLPTIQTGN